MSGTVLASSIDYLVALFTTATSALTLNGHPVVVFDGISLDERNEWNTVVVGGSDAPTSTAATRGFVTTSGTGNGLAPGGRQEEFAVDCYVRCSLGEPSTAAQSNVRAAAVSVFAALETALLTDPRLGGLLTTFPALIPSQTLAQTTPEDAAARRWARIDFGVLIRNRY